MAMHERRTLAGTEAEVARPGLLGAERLTRNVRLPAIAEAVRRGRVLDVGEVDPREPGRHLRRPLCLRLGLAAPVAGVTRALGRRAQPEAALGRPPLALLTAPPPALDESAPSAARGQPPASTVPVTCGLPFFASRSEK